MFTVEEVRPTLNIVWAHTVHTTQRVTQFILDYLVGQDEQDIAKIAIHTVHGDIIIVIITRMFQFHVVSNLKTILLIKIKLFMKKLFAK